MNSGRDVAQNLQQSRELAAKAAAGGAKWLALPENAPFLGRDEEKIPIAEHEDGSIVSAYRDMARENALWIAVGSYPEKIDGAQQTYNTFVVISDAGEVVARYRKIHLFDAQVEGGVSFRESDSVRAGDEVVTTEMPIDGDPTTVGLSVCYDLRFPELYREQTRRGAEVLFIPAAFTLQTGRDHWDALLRARAIENQCWVVAAAQFGHHFGPRWSYGHSAVYDPWGQRIACASDRVGLVFADVDREYVTAVRRRMPCLEHRRL
jgi:predicted amidohydrolase